MKKVALFVLLGTVFNISLSAIEYEARSEFIYCNLNEGMTVSDAAEQAKAYGKFSKEQGTKYMQHIIVPIHAGDTDYDYMLMGSWPDGKSMYEEWGSYLNDYGDGSSDVSMPAGECTARVAAFNTGVVHNRIDMQDWDKRRPVQFSGCKLKDGASMSDVHNVMKEDSRLLSENGFSGYGRNTLTTYLGFKADYPYDFVDMFHWDSFERRGHMAQNYGKFADKYPDVETSYSDITECAPSRSFYIELLFNNVN